MHRWKHSALASAALLAAGFCWSNASALTLGQIQVESRLGQPLRATIPVSNLSSAEAESLSVGPASPAVFNAHGANYSATMTSLRVSLQQHSNGSAFLQLTTSTPVNEPFVDLILDTAWSGGNITRAYALLLDPPGSPAAPGSTIAAQSQPASAGIPVLPPASPASVSPVSSALPVVPLPVSGAVSTPAAVPPPPPVRAPASPAASTPLQPAADNEVYQRAREWMQSTRRPTPQPVAAAQPGQVTPGPVTPGPVTPGPVTAASPPAASAPAASAPAARAATVVTRRGDTAGAIARRHLPANVSMDQMLVALQRANPQAFIQENVNLLRSGVSLSIPDADSARAVSAQEARQLIAAQSQDFGRYRNRLAQNVPAAPAEPRASNVAGGAITAATLAPSPAVGDELVLSSQQVAQAGHTQEAEIAIAKQQAENLARTEEADANTRRMQQLLDEIKLASAESAGSTGQGPASDSGGLLALDAQSPLPLPATAQSGSEDAGIVAVAPDPVALPPAGSPDMDGAVAETVALALPLPDDALLQEEAEPPPESAVADASPAPLPALQPQPLPELHQAGFFSSLAEENPYLPPLGAALLALLLGYGYYRYRRNRAEPEVVYENSGDVPSSFFADSRPAAEAGTAGLAPASVGMATTVLTGNSTSMSYSPSQMDVSGDGDPVLEADVLMAYGRDQQAEEILRDAELANPERTAIKLRLAEIHAARQDTAAFESKAGEIAALSGKTGPDWEKICETGHRIDPSNPLYLRAAPGMNTGSAVPATSQPQGRALLSEARPAAEAPLLSDFGPLSDLGLDFQAPDTKPARPSGSARLTQAAAASSLSKLGLDDDQEEYPGQSVALTGSTAPGQPLLHGDLQNLQFEPPAAQDGRDDVLPPAAPYGRPTPASSGIESQMPALDLDMSSLLEPQPAGNNTLAPATLHGRPTPASSGTEPQMPSLDLDLPSLFEPQPAGSNTLAPATLHGRPTSASSGTESQMPSLDLGLPSLFEPQPAGSNTLPPAALHDRPTPVSSGTEPRMPALDLDLPSLPASQPAGDHPLEPDLPHLDFDLSPLASPGPESVPAAAIPEAPADDAGEQTDPMVTKLELAREFQALGDNESARLLALEVLHDAQGMLGHQAQALLDELG